MNRISYLTKLRGVFLILAFGLLFYACDSSPSGADDDEEDNATEGIEEVEGNIDGYDLGENELYKAEDFVDLGEGKIEEDGSFIFAFFELDRIEDALKPLGNDSSDDFVGMYCRDVISESLDSGNQFVDVGVLNFTYGEDNNLAMIGLSSNQVNNNVFPPQSDFSGDFHVRWIFSNEEVTINEECDEESSETGQNIVDLELIEGWNEVYFDLSDSEDKRQYTGERPAEVDWVLEE